MNSFPLTRPVELSCRDCQGGSASAPELCKVMREWGNTTRERTRCYSICMIIDESWGIHLGLVRRAYLPVVMEYTIVKRLRRTHAPGREIVRAHVLTSAWTRLKGHVLSTYTKYTHPIPEILLFDLWTLTLLAIRSLASILPAHSFTIRMDRACS